MSKFFKVYAVDAMINTLAQFFILFAGSFAYLFGYYAFFGWVLIVIGYSFVLAKMSRGCERKKGAALGHYFLYVLLPPNVIACVVSIPFFAVGLSSQALRANVTSGWAVIGGSLAITLLSIICTRVLLSEDRD